MANALKVSGALGLARLAVAPSSPENGYMYYDTVLNKVRVYENGSFVDATGISSPDFESDVFRVSDESDPTKKVALDVSAVSPGTTRTITVPDTEINLADIATNTADISDLEADKADRSELEQYLPIGSVRAASTANIAALEDAPFTADGIEIPDGDLILVKDQTDETENGVYIVGAGPWERIGRLKDGDIIFIGEGVKQQGQSWKCQTNFPFPDFGTDDIFFQRVSYSPDRPLGGRGAQAFSDIDVTLSGEQTIDGVALVDGNSVLLGNQSDNTENGLWTVRSSDWERETNFGRNILVKVYGGTDHNEKSFIIDANGNNDINFGTDAIFVNLVALNPFQINDRLEDAESRLDDIEADYVTDADLSAYANPFPNMTLATTGPVTLSGVQVVDGVTTDDDMDVIVKDQVDPIENGLYNTSDSGAWTRINTERLKDGSLVKAANVGGVQNGGRSYQCIVNGGSIPIDYGTAEIFFTEVGEKNTLDITQLRTEVDALVDLSGVAAEATDLGSFTGAIISDGNTIKGALQELETAIEDLPNPITYQGTWDASTNTPTLDNADTGVDGYLYQVNVAGTVDFGAGNISFEIGDKVVNNGTVWEKWDMTDAVSSVNGQTGAVVLALDDLDDVDATAPNDGDVLTFDTGSGEWIPAAPASGTTFSDATFRVQDDGDATKQLAFEVSGIATATTRTITILNENINLSTGTSSSFANRTLNNLGTTSINSDLLPSAADVRHMGSSTLRWNQWHGFTSIYYSGTSSEVGRIVGSGSLTMSTPNAVSSNAITIFSGSGSTTSSGAVSMVSGASNGLSGTATLASGNASTNSGAVNITSGNSATAGNSGDISLSTGTITSGTRGSVIVSATSLKRQKAASDFVEEEYFHAIALTGSQTNTVITSLTFAHATFEGLEMTYKVKEATSNDVRIGTLRIVTNGTDISFNDMSTETADTGITFDAVVNGANINVRYSSGTNAATLRADVKRIKA